jgi:GNAT superfamily N-acetyltransferase
MRAGPQSSENRRSNIAAAGVTIRPLSSDLMPDLGRVLRGGWGAGCWCLYPRLTESCFKTMAGEGSMSDRRRAAMAALASGARSPGLLAFAGDEPAGWVAIAPRSEYARIVASRATPPVDDLPVWVIPCITVRKSMRGRGIALALIEAAVGFAREQGARAVEAYPRAGEARVSDASAYFGTEPMFRRAGFEVVRRPPEGQPRNHVLRLAMRRYL